MNIKSKALGIIGIATIGLGMTAGVAFAQTTTGTLTTGGSYQCTSAEMVSEFGFTSASGTPFTLDTDQKTATTEAGAFKVRVDTNCNHMPWTLNVASTDFSVAAGMVGEFYLPAHSFSAGLLTLTPVGDPTFTMDPRGLQNLFLLGIDPNIPTQVATLLDGHEPVAFTATGPTTATEILKHNHENPAWTAPTPLPLAPSPVGGPGVTMANYTGSLANLPVLRPGSTYTATLTLDLVIAPPTP